jgi:hypothetical protein
MGLIIEEALPQVTGTRVCTDGSSSSGITDGKSFDKTIYRVLSMQDDMKTLEAPERVKSEFDIFIKYAQSKTAGVVYDSRFDQLDAYLGTIGITNEMC